MDPDRLEVGLDPRLAEAGVHVAWVAATALANRPQDPDFAEVYGMLHSSLVTGTTRESVLEDPRIAGYRALHERFGGRLTAMAPAPESLFRALFEHGALRPVNLVVDVYNFVSLKHRISAGAHDLARLGSRVSLAITRGGERFVPLGRSQPQCVPAGEYAYFDVVGDGDGDGEIICRRECRQSERTKIRADTRDVLFILQGHAAITRAAVEAAVAELRELLARWCGSAGRERVRYSPECQGPGRS